MLYSKQIASFGLFLIIVVLLPACSAIEQFQKQPETKPVSTDIQTTTTDGYDKGKEAFHGGDYAQAMRLLQPLAQQNNAEAQYAMGYMYYYGQGVQADRLKAIEWFRRAAENNSAKAIDALTMLALQQSGLNPTSLRRNDVEVAQPQITTVTSPLTIEQNELGSGRQIAIPTESGGLLAQDSAHFTIQLISSRNEDEIRSFIEMHNLANEAQYYQANKNGLMFSVVYGTFPTIEAAKQALLALPASLQRNQPWVRSFKDIQEEIRSSEQRF